MIIRCSYCFSGAQDQSRCRDIVRCRISRKVTFDCRGCIVVDNAAARRFDADVTSRADELAKINVIGGKQPDVAGS